MNTLAGEAAKEHRIAIVHPSTRACRGPSHELKQLAGCLGPMPVSWHTWQDALATPALAAPLQALAGSDKAHDMRRAAGVFITCTHAQAAWLDHPQHGCMCAAELLVRLAGLFQCSEYVPQLWRPLDLAHGAQTGLRITLKHALVVPRWVAKYRWPHDAHFLSKLQRYPLVLARATLVFDPAAADEDVPCITNSSGARLVGAASCAQWLKSLKAQVAESSS